MYNKAILIGRLTADPDLRTTPNGVNVATFRIAVNRPHDREKADFITIVAWRKSAEFVCTYFAKGSAIGVEGAIQMHDYSDKDGNKRYSFEVVAEKVFFVESKKASVQQQPTAAIPAEGSLNDFEQIDGDGDLPF